MARYTRSAGIHRNGYSHAVLAYYHREHRSGWTLPLLLRKMGLEYLHGQPIHCRMINVIRQCTVVERLLGTVEEALGFGLHLFKRPLATLNL